MRTCATSIRSDLRAFEPTLRPGEDIDFYTARISTFRAGLNKLVFFRTGHGLISKSFDGLCQRLQFFRFDEKLRAQKEVKIIRRTGLGPFPPECSTALFGHVDDFKVDTKAAADDDFDFRALHFVEQVEQRCLKVYDGDHCLACSTPFKINDFTCSAVSLSRLSPAISSR